MQINLELDDILYKGDTIIIPCTVSEAITTWEIRAELYDHQGHSSRLATANVTGGSDEQIETDIDSGSENNTFTLYFPSSETTEFETPTFLAIKRTDVNGNEKTIFNSQILIEDEVIDWTDKT